MDKKEKRWGKADKTVYSQLVTEEFSSAWTVVLGSSYFGGGGGSGGIAFHLTV